MPEQPNKTHPPDTDYAYSEAEKRGDYVTMSSLPGLHKVGRGTISEGGLARDKLGYKPKKKKAARKR